MVHGLDLNKRAVIQNAQYILSWVDAESTAALRETYESYGFTWLGDVEGIRSIDYPNETRGVGVYKTMARGEGWMVYDILSYTDGLGMEEMQDVLSQTDFDPSATAMLGENDFQKLTMPSGENHKGDVKTQSMRVNQTDLSVETSEHGLLATAQINYPGWRVYIDGVYSPHVEINGGFIGVPIEAGTHEVVLRYEPVSFYVGAGVAIGTLGLCGVLAVLLWRRVVKNKRQPACKALEAEGGNQETRQM